MAGQGIPTHFTTLPTDVVLSALEGHVDVLSGEHLKAEALYRQHKDCPNGCGPSMEKHFGGVQFAFADKSWHVPRCLMRCYACGCTINPFDGMLVALGNKDKAVYGDVPIIKLTDD